MEDAEYTTELEDVILDAAQVFQGVLYRIAAAGVVSIPMDARVAALLTHAEFIAPDGRTRWRCCSKRWTRRRAAACGNSQEKILRYFEFSVYLVHEQRKRSRTQSSTRSWARS